ncbi:hypothetical protein FRC00_003387, partial [Tulasnella sp. 408]
MPILGAQSVVGEAPLASGHEHATLADELQAAGDLVRAIEEHRIAAAEYLKSVEYTPDTNNDAGDRFNRFWSNVEAQLDQITQPVAFAALPLSGESPALEIEGTNAGSQYTRSSTSTIKGKGKERVEPRVVPLDFDGDDSSDSDSWNLVPSSQPPSRHGSVFRPPPAPVDTRMKEENDRLRAELEEVKARLSNAEVIIKTRRGQEAQLRESIMIAKREAHRTLLQSTTLRQATLQSLALTPMSPAVPPVPDGSSQGTQSPFMSPLPGPPSGTASPTATTAMQRRIKDLEDENKRLNSENIKLSAQYTKLKE